MIRLSLLLKLTRMSAIKRLFLSEKSGVNKLPKGRKYTYIALSLKAIVFFSVKNLLLEFFQRQEVFCIFRENYRDISVPLFP